MNLFVTGATGFIGKDFISLASQQGHNVKALVRPSSISKIQEFDNVEWIISELFEVKKIDFSNIDVLVHLASAGVSPQPADIGVCYKFNVLDSLKLIDQALDGGVEKIICSGTYAEYGLEAYKYDAIPPNIKLRPVGIYASSKAAFFLSVESLCRERNFILSYQRLFSVFGEGQYKDNFWPQLREKALKGEDFKMTMGEQIRDFIHVSDVNKKLLYECERNDLKNGNPHVQNLASGKPITLRDFAEKWWRTWNAKGKLYFGDIPYRKNEVMRYIPLINQ